MAIEETRIRLIPKPWGRTDLRPWNLHHDAAAMGELWFERTNASAPNPALLLKLLFTSAPLSIQVHPDDLYARSIGLDHGKCEAWYVLAAAAGAQIAVGLKHRLTSTQLRASICDGSIAEHVQWRAVRAGETALVRPGTIHAIGAGLVLVEIQQRSEATFRLFDYGRRRELHVDAAVAAASADQSELKVPLRKLSAARTVLVASPHFVLERVAFSPGSIWKLNATRETWLFILTGHARAGPIDMHTGNAIFIEADRMHIEVGPEGLEGLIAYAGSASAAELLCNLRGSGAQEAAQGADRVHFQARAMPLTRARAARAAA